MNQYYGPLQSIRRNTASVPGGYARLLYCPVEWLENADTAFVPNPATGVLDSVLIEAVPSKLFFEAAVPNIRKDYLEEQADEPAGDFMNITINAFVPFDSKANHLSMDNMKYYRFVCLVVHADGMVKVIGHPLDGARFKHRKANGDAPRNVPGTAIQFIWKSKDKPLLYEGDLPL